MPQAFSDDGTGLLINERLINCPPKLAPPLMQFLFGEIKEAAAAKGKAGELFRFKRFLVATRVFRDDEKNDMGPPPSKAAKKGKVRLGATVGLYF